MIPTAIVAVIAIVAVFVFGWWSRRDNQRANKFEVAGVKQDVAVDLLESDLTASRQQRKNLVSTLGAAENRTLVLQKDIENVVEEFAKYVPRDVLNRASDRLCADVDDLLSFTKGAIEADDSNGDADKLPAIGATISGTIDPVETVPTE